MIKHYCDQCKNEITRNYASERLIRTAGQFEIEVIVTYKNTANKGDICLDCLLDIINRGAEKLRVDIPIALIGKRPGQ